MRNWARSWVVVLCGVVLWLGNAQAANDGWLVTDRFGRSLDAVGIPLLDWEGHLANPVTELTLTPPDNVAYPLSVSLSADHVRLYFSNPSETSINGPSKSLFFADSAPQTVGLAIFPDRAAGDESYTLTLDIRDASDLHTTQTLPIHVRDLDQPLRPLAFKITYDYRRDAADQRFFADDLRAQQIARLAADDWTYFIADMNLDTVAAGAEETYTWDPPNGFYGGIGSFYTNHTAYQGFRIYLYGITCELGTQCTEDGFSRPIFSSGISANDLGAVQSSDGIALAPSLFRSGLIDINVRGDYDTEGWYYDAGDDDWQSFDMRFGSPNDLYSVVQHEIGHALAFNLQYPAFPPGGELSSSALLAYYGSPLATQRFSHFDGVLDPASQFGAFGNEYGSAVPSRRWLVTKLDLLLLEAVGYELRPTTPFIDLAITNRTRLSAARVGVPYEATLSAISNTPIFLYGIAGEPVPRDGLYDLGNGLSLDSFTGRISGNPQSATPVRFIAEVCDSSTLSDHCRQRAIVIAIN